MNTIVTKIDDLLRVFKKTKSFKKFAKEDLEFLIKNKETFAKRILGGWTSKEQYFSAPLERLETKGAKFYPTEVRSLQNSIRKTLEKIGFGTNETDLIRAIEKEWISNFDNYVKKSNLNLWKEISQNYKKFKITIPKKTFQNVSGIVSKLTKQQQNYAEEFTKEFENYMKLVADGKNSASSEKKLADILKSAVKSENDSFKNIFFNIKQDLIKIKGVDKAFIDEFEKSDNYKEITKRFLKKNQVWWKQILDVKKLWKNLFQNLGKKLGKGFWYLVYYANNPLSIFRLWSKTKNLKISELKKKSLVGYLSTKFIVTIFEAVLLTFKNSIKEGKQLVSLYSEGEIFPNEEGGVPENETWGENFLYNVWLSKPNELKDFAPWYFTDFKKIFDLLEKGNKWNAEKEFKSNYSPNFSSAAEKFYENIQNNSQANSDVEFGLLFSEPEFTNKFKTINDTTKTFVTTGNKIDTLKYDTSLGWIIKMIDSKTGDTLNYDLASPKNLEFVKKNIK